MATPPKLPPGVRRLFRLPWSRSRVLREVNDEVRFHLEMRMAALQARGMTPAQAEAEALRRFGDVHELEESAMRVADQRARTHRFREELTTSAQDVRLALRRLRASPMFTVAAILTLSLAIGATSAVFGLVDGVLLKAFPFRDPDRVLTLWESNSGSHQPHSLVAPANYFDWLAQNTTFTTLAAVGAGWEFTVNRTNEAERVKGEVVTPSYFPVLGITPILGRPLSPDDGGPPTEVVISYGYWQRRFGGARSVIGQVLNLENGDDQSPPPRRHIYTIVGVMPEGLPGPSDMWVRLYFEPREHEMHNIRYLNVYGRLKPGVSPETGQRDLETIADRLAVAYPATNVNWSVVTVPLLDDVLGPLRPALIMLLAAAACVLLIGAANLANLFLVRCLAREREMAVRTALGATRRRLMRELVAEASMLGLVAGVVGIGLTIAGIRALRTLAPATLPRLNEVGVDGRVLSFCALISLGTVAVFGLLPAWQASRDSVASYLKEGSHGTGSATQHRLQDGLVLLQVAVALVLLTGAGLLVKSFDHFLRMDPGFQADGVLTARVAFPGARYPTPDTKKQFIAGVLDRLAADPEVRNVSVSSWLPGAGTPPLPPFSIIGDPAPDSSHAPGADMLAVSPDYFRLMQIPLRRGRSLLPSDDGRTRKVVVVDELLAARFFAGRDPIGHQIMYSYGSDTMEIVGVVGSVRQNGLAAASVPQIYGPVAQHAGYGGAFIEVRTAGDPLGETRALKRVIAGLDPLMPVYDVKTERDRLIQSVGDTRFSSVLASLFALLALVLGIVGVYSVLASIVTQRQREIAVRMALGASPSHVMNDVLLRALRLAAGGIAIGSAAAWMLTRALSNLFLGVSPHDPTVFAGAAVAFALVALAAASIPAFRATRVNPVVALTSG